MQAWLLHMAMHANDIYMKKKDRHMDEQVYMYHSLNKKLFMTNE